MGNYRLNEVSSAGTGTVQPHRKCSHPGLINTPLTRHKERYATSVGNRRQVATGLSTVEEEEDAGRFLSPGHRLACHGSSRRLAPGVVFLASDAARMVSGATYEVTGGDSANNTA